MANKKRHKTEAEKAIQRIRTHRNKVRKYKKLIKENPNHKDLAIWKKKLAHSEERCG